MTFHGCLKMWMWGNPIYNIQWDETRGTGGHPCKLYTALWKTVDKWNLWYRCHRYGDPTVLLILCEQGQSVKKHSCFFAVYVMCCIFQMITFVMLCSLACEQLQWKTEANLWKHFINFWRKVNVAESKSKIVFQSKQTNFMLAWLKRKRTENCAIGMKMPVIIKWMSYVWKMQTSYGKCVQISILKTKQATYSSRIRWTKNETRI